MANDSGLYDYDKEIKDKKSKNKKIKKEKANKKPSNQIKADNEIIIGVTVTNQQKNNEKNKKNKVKAKEKQKKGKKIIEKETRKNADTIAAKKQKTKKKAPDKVKKNVKKQSLETENSMEIDYFSKDIFEDAEEKKDTKASNFLKWTSILVVVIGVTVFAMVSPIFNIKNINVTGNSKIDSEKIISLSGIEKGNNLFRINKTQISKQIKKNGYIEDIKIIRKLPDTIEINVIERVPGFQIKYGNGYVVINNQGYIIKISEESEELPFLEGMTTPEDKYIETNRLAEEDLYKLNTVLKIVSAAASNGIDSLITLIDISDINNVKLEFEEDEKTAYIGDCSNIETRMLWVKHIMEKEEDNAGEIIVNMNLNTDNPYFRKSID